MSARSKLRSIESNLGKNEKIYIVQITIQTSSKMLKSDDTWQKEIYLNLGKRYQQCDDSGKNVI